MNTKKFVTSAASVITAGALIIGGTFAYFSDTDTSVGNTFTAGVLDIELQTLAGDPLNGEAYFIADGMMPGDTVSECIAVSNEGTVGFNWSLMGTLTDDEEPNELAEVMLARTYVWGDSENPPVDCGDNVNWEATFPIALPVLSVINTEVGQGSLNPPDKAYYKFVYSLPTTVGPEYMGTSASFDATVKAYQLGDPAYDEL